MRRVRSRNLVNEEIMAHWGTVAPNKEKSVEVPNLTGCVFVSMDVGLLYREDDGAAIFRNVGNYSSNGTASRPARLESSATLL
jgi:hypothetical protein